MVTVRGRRWSTASSITGTGAATYAADIISGWVHASVVIIIF
jgi:aspartate/tyrosine/aromatic aminotransferase